MADPPSDRTALTALFVLLCAIALPSVVASQEPPVLKVLHTIRDQKDSGGPVGGHYVAGLMLGEPAQINLKRAMLILPRHLESRLCVALLARDDSYKGLFEYDASSTGEGLRRLEIASKYLTYLQTLAGTDLAVSAWLAADCSMGPADALRIPVSWGPQADRRAHVFVNSGIYIAYIMVGDDADARSVRCAELEPPQPTFNRDCALILPTTQSGIVRVKLQMSRYGTLIDESVLRISVP
jgi:hypothetical protein